ncbi:ABC-three component system protein [Streptomyces glaucescens]|uniref:ABC-three component system protein n=1 Tax=Streptomyces glaucescens TaxID=1907 RepID=UPI000A3A6705|nr:ABC-three component system protein [Streptomyces glaucescens]
MFISKLTSSDARFKTLRFHEGLNILIADRTEASEQGDSRNSIGKTSVVKILRYVLGGDLPLDFKAPELSNHKFTVTFLMPNESDTASETVTVTRSVARSTRVDVSGWSATEGARDLHVDTWRALLTRHIFHIPPDVSRPTAGQLWGQLIRTYFGNPIKGHQAEADWESGVRIGYMLGLSPEILGKAGDVDRLTKQGKAIRKAVKDGAIAHLSLDEPALRAQLATARRHRDRMQESMRSFKVDEQYASHQQEADGLTASIQRLNDEALALQRRSRELDEALRDEVVASESSELSARLTRVYAEIGLVLPDIVSRRYDEVAAFHESVVSNRRAFLEQELHAIEARLNGINTERQALDRLRSQVMQILEETVALDTFMSMQRDLAKQEANIADLERRLEDAISISTINDTVKLRTAEVIASVRTEMIERDQKIEESISLFSDLGAEIYTDREASLLVSVTPKGILGVVPNISGDASVGVRSVETFMLDVVCEIAAIKAKRAPRILVHDSHLFDAIDGRQVASCLNIGARLAEENGFQYIVTLNSDFLETVEAQSDGAFNAEPYILDTRLTDEDDEGGLFGFRFG